ncbi:MAG: pirin family protein [Rickettsiales bacterium]
MSNLELHCERDCEILDRGNFIEAVVAPKEKDLGGFSVRRLLPTKARRMVGPWVFFDHMGPAEFGAGPGINVRPHPHIGIATVTYLFTGEILHRDSLGSCQPIRPGDINLMVAGRGIVHSERERPECTTTTRTLDGLQLWLALPEDQESIAPAFYHYPSAQIPKTVVNGVPVRIMMGSAYQQHSPVKLHSQTLYLEAQMTAGQQLPLPDVAERAVYVVNGELQLGDTVIPQHSMAFIKQGAELSISATIDTRLAVIGGETMSPRYMEWNFVSSDKAKLEQARLDWQQGRFDKVPGDEDEFIPFPG